jgi:septal ring factor EnvC (AmiA/AmiB activator)
MRIDVYHHVVIEDSATAAALDRIERGIASIKRTETRQMARLDEIKTATQENSDAVDSAITLINGLADQLEEAQGDPAEVAAIVAELRGDAQSLAEAVAANTKADGGGDGTFDVGEGAGGGDVGGGGAEPTV